VQRAPHRNYGFAESQAFISTLPIYGLAEPSILLPRFGTIAEARSSYPFAGSVPDSRHRLPCAETVNEPRSQVVRIIRRRSLPLYAQHEVFPGW